MSLPTDVAALLQTDNGRCLHNIQTYNLFYSISVTDYTVSTSPYVSATIFGHHLSTLSTIPFHWPMFTSGVRSYLYCRFLIIDLITVNYINFCLSFRRVRVIRNIRVFQFTIQTYFNFATALKSFIATLALIKLK
jgi:hypothetical protein